MKLNFRFIIIYLLVIKNVSLAQFELIETFTNSDLLELHNYNNETLIFGMGNYFGKLQSPQNNVTMMTAPGPDTNVIHSFNRIDANIAYIASTYPWFGNSHNFIFKTIDNCQTWNMIFDTNDVKIHYLRMFDNLEGIFINPSYKHFRTIDNCVSWTLENDTYLSVDAIEVFDDSTICITELQTFGISHDRGNTWQYGTINEEVNINSVDFISKDTILSCAYGNGMFFSKSINSGLNWQFNMLSGNVFPTKVKHLTNETIYMVGKNTVFDEFSNPIDHGLIMKSDDFGNTWSYFDTELLTCFRDIVFLDDSIALICGTNGILIKYNYRDHYLGFEKHNNDKTSFKIFPNPAIYGLNIQTNYKEIYKTLILEVRDLSGKIVQTQKLNSNLKNQSIDISKLTNGEYLLELIGDGKSISTEKLVIEK